MGGAPELPCGLVTQPAELPPMEVGAAVDLALRGRSLPTVPVPVDPRYSLLARVVTAFEGVHLLPNAQLRVDPATFGVRPDEAESTASEGFAPLRETLRRWPEQRRRGVVGLRVELAGPVTLALALVRGGLDHARSLDAARTVSAFRAEAVLAEVRAVEPDHCVVVVMSEPGLCGSMHPTFPLTTRQVRSLLDPVVDVLDRAAGGSPVVIGIHVPGSADWRTVISSGVSMVSLRPEASVVGWAPQLATLLDNGGYVAWGAVPVDRPLGTNEELLWRHLARTWRDLEAAGVDRPLLVRRSLVGPSDGLGRFGAEQVPGILALADALAGRIRALVEPPSATAG